MLRSDHAPVNSEPANDALPEECDFWPAYAHVARPLITAASWDTLDAVERELSRDAERRVGRSIFSAETRTKLYGSN